MHWCNDVNSQIHDHLDHVARTSFYSYIGPTRGNSEKESTVNCHDERRIVLMSVSLAILAVLIAIGAITSAVDQVSSMRRELSEIGDIAAAGAPLGFSVLYQNYLSWIGLRK